MVPPQPQFLLGFSFLSQSSPFEPQNYSRLAWKNYLAAMSAKIAFIVNSSWNIYNFRKGLVRRFIEQGDDVLAISPTDEYVPKLEAWGVKHIPVELDGSGLNPAKDYAYLRLLKKILRQEKPDVILSYTIKSNIYGSLAARACKISIICNVSGLGTTFLWKGWLRRAAIALYNRAFRSTDFIFFQNADDRKLFLEQVRVNKSKTGLLPGSGIDLAHFKSSVPAFDQPIKFLMISRLILEKGVLEYLEAARKVSQGRNDIEFFLLGKFDPEHKRSINQTDFEEIVSGKSVKYLGEEDNVKSVIEEADVVVLPSYREGTPRTLLEAAAMSRPLITTDVPGCREVVSDGVNGFLCEATNAESFAQKMELFLALTTDEKKSMGDASRKLVEKRFDENIVIGEYSRKIKQLLPQ